MCIYAKTIHLIGFVFSQKVGSVLSFVALKNHLNPHWDSRNDLWDFSNNIWFWITGRMFVLPSATASWNQWLYATWGPRRCSGAHCPPTSEACNWNPRPYVAKMVVSYWWSAVYSIDPWPTVCTGFLCLSWYELHSVETDIKAHINK